MRTGKRWIYYTLYYISYLYIQGHKYNYIYLYILQSLLNAICHALEGIILWCSPVIQTVLNQLINQFKVITLFWLTRIESQTYSLSDFLSHKLWSLKAWHFRIYLYYIINTNIPFIIISIRIRTSSKCLRISKNPFVRRLLKYSNIALFAPSNSSTYSYMNISYSCIITWVNLKGAPSKLILPGEF